MLIWLENPKGVTVPWLAGIYKTTCQVEQQQQESSSKSESRLSPGLPHHTPLPRTETT